MPGKRSIPTLVFAVAAVFLGSALGSSEVLSPGCLRALVLATPLLAAALAHARGASEPFRWIPILVALGCAAAMRALPDPGAGPAGAWIPAWASRDAEIGRVGASPRRFALVPGSVESGETILLLDGEAPRTPARGPEVGPAQGAAASGLPAERSPDEVVRLAARPPSLPAGASAILGRVRGRLLERISKLSDPLTRGLVGGLLFGDLTDLPPGVGDLFVRTGTFHILAISGLQVALFAVLLAGPAASLGARLLRIASAGRLRARADSLRSAILLLFVPVAGAGPPVTRSALGFIVASLAVRIRVREPFVQAVSVAAHPVDRFQRRGSDPLSLWSLALLVECLVHPDAPLSLSVQLTYGATLGLILSTGPVARRIESLLPGEGRIAGTGASGRPRPEWVRILAQRLCRGTVRAVAASCAAVLATLPVVWTRFGEFSPSGVLATPAIALPVAWILVTGWTWLAVPDLVPEVLLELPARGMIGALELFDRLPGTPSPLPPRPALLLVLGTCLAVWALRSPGRAWIRRGAAAAWTALLLPWTVPPVGLEVIALDVGHGTSVLLRTPGGGVWVFDAGSRDRPGVDREALGPLLGAWEASRVAVVLSHPDRDHDGALDWLVERHPPRVWAGALPAHLAERLPHTTSVTDSRPGRTLLPGLDAGEIPLRMELVRGLPDEGNEGSRCLEVRWRDRWLVLFGDAEEEGLEAWIRESHAELPADLLLFPHHGSESRNLAPLLAATRPREVWISNSGEPPVGRELDRRGLRWRTTSREGWLRLELP